METTDSGAANVRRRRTAVHGRARNRGRLLGGAQLRRRRLGTRGPRRNARLPRRLRRRRRRRPAARTGARRGRAASRAALSARRSWRARSARSAAAWSRCSSRCRSCILVPGGLGIALAGLLVWISLWLGFRVVGGRSAAMLEMLGLSSRPLVRAQAYDAHDGLLLDSSVIMDGQLLGLARAGLLGGDLMVPGFVLYGGAGLRRRARRDPVAPRAPRARDARGRSSATDPSACTCSTTKCPSIARGRRQARRARAPARAAAAHQRRRARPHRRAPRCRHRQPPPARDRARPGDHARRLRAGLRHQVAAASAIRASVSSMTGRWSSSTAACRCVGGPEVSLQVTSVVPTSVGRIVFASVDEHIERADPEPARD